MNPSGFLARPRYIAPTANGTAPTRRYGPIIVSAVADQVARSQKRLRARQATPESARQEPYIAVIPRDSGICEGNATANKGTDTNKRDRPTKLVRVAPSSLWGKLGRFGVFVALTSPP